LLSPLPITVGCGDGLGDRRRRIDHRAGLLDLGDCFRVHVVGVDVGDEDEVRRRQSFIVTRAGGIHVDHFSAAFDHEAGVLYGRDFHHALAGGKLLHRPGGLSQRWKSGENNGSQ